MRHLGLFLTSSLCRSAVHFALRKAGWKVSLLTWIGAWSLSAAVDVERIRKWPTGLTEVVLVQILRRVMLKRLRLTLSGLALG